MASFLAATARLGAQYATPALACGFVAASHHNKGTAATADCESSSSTSSPSNHKKQPNASAWSSSSSYRRRMTNVGRFSLLSETLTNPSIPVMVLAMSGEQEWTPADFLKLYQDRKISERHERFRATLDPNDWTHMQFLPHRDHDPHKHPLKHHHLNRHEAAITIKVDQAMSYPQIYRSELKDWITDAVVQSIDLSTGLWEARTATGGKVGQSGAIPRAQAEKIALESPNAVESLLLFRAHHCMADGVSLGAIFGDLMDEGEDFQAIIAQKVNALQTRTKKSWWKRLQFLMYYWGWGSIRAFAYQLYLYWQSWISPPDPWSVLLLKAATADDDDDDELAQQSQPRRTVSWVSIASVTEVKEVAQYFSQHTRGKITVNDVFCSCISGAIAKLIRYHQVQHPELKGLLKLPYMNLVIPVHMQGGILLPGQSMGNKIGAMVNRVPAEAATDPQDRLTQVHSILWDRKQTPAAVWSYLAAKTFGGMGSRLNGWTPWLFEKAHANATVVVTNVRGPETPVHLDGRRVETTLGFLPLPPGIPIGMVIGSYANRLTLTIMAEPSAVPDADLFLSWVVEEYQALLQQAKTGNGTKQN